MIDIYNKCSFFRCFKINALDFEKVK